jgi:RNA polymerase sigma-70 factor (ECF subfamily)
VWCLAGESSGVKRDLLAMDDGQLSSLYERWRLPVARMLRRYFGSPAEAEDAAQEVFVRLAAAGKAIPLAEEQPYLRRAARNVAIDGWRKSAGRENLQQVSLDAEYEEPGLQTDGDHTAARAGWQQMATRLDEALQELPTRQREAFVLHRIEGHTVDETADRMGISSRMVVKHLSRALAYCQVRVAYASGEQMRQAQAALHGLDGVEDAA